MLNMHPLPIEGGFFSVTYNSDDILEASHLPSRYHEARNMGGAINFLVTTEEFSALHRLPTDELYYYHFGDPLELLILGPEDSGRKMVLGMELSKGQRPQILAPRNWWQGSRPVPGGQFGYSLISTSMAPAYHKSDPEFGSRDQLQQQYPQFSEIIGELTRS